MDSIANGQFYEAEPEMDKDATASGTPLLLRGEYVTKAEAAEGLGYSEATLDRWHRLRVGPPRTKIGKRVLYRRDTLKAWLIAQEEALTQRHA